MLGIIIHLLLLVSLIYIFQCYRDLLRLGWSRMICVNLIVSYGAMSYQEPTYQITCKIPKISQAFFIKLVNDQNHNYG